MSVDSATVLKEILEERQRRRAAGGDHHERLRPYSGSLPGD